jgi:hypothetical protein
MKVIQAVHASEKGVRVWASNRRCMDVTRSERQEI